MDTKLTGIIFVLMLCMGLAGGCGQAETEEEIIRTVYAVRLAEEEGKQCVAEDSIVVGEFEFKQEWWADERELLMLIKDNLLVLIHPGETDVIDELKSMGWTLLMNQNSQFSSCSFFDRPEGR